MVNIMYAQTTWPYSIQRLGGVTFLAQDSLSNSWYYLEEEPHLIATDEDDCPQIEVVHGSYDGTRVTGNLEESRSLTHLNFKLITGPTDEEAWRAVRDTFGIKDLRPLPVTSVEASVLITTTRGNDTTLIGKSNHSYEGAWSMLQWTIPLNKTDGILLDQAFRRGGSLVSVTLRYYARMNGKDNVLAKETAFTLAVSEACLNQVISSVPINGRMAEFPILTVIHEGFLNDPKQPVWRRDAFVRLPDFSISGYRELRRSFFPGKQSLWEISSDVPLKLNHPLQVRVTDYLNDGSTDERQWRTVTNGWGLLNISNF